LFLLFIVIVLFLYVASSVLCKDTTPYRNDPDIVRVFIYYDGNENSRDYDVKMLKLSDVLSYDGKWLVCDNSDGTKNYYYNCRLVIYRVGDVQF